MPSAPSSTVDPSGVLRWTNPGTPPALWVVELVYADGTYAGYQNLSDNALGSADSYDAYTNMWKGGYYIKLSGLDANANLVFEPTLSTNVTKNQ